MELKGEAPEDAQIANNCDQKAVEKIKTEGMEFDQVKVLFAKDSEKLSTLQDSEFELDSPKVAPIPSSEQQ